MAARDTIAVTGATGFIGGRIVERLVNAGYTVRALTRRPKDSTADVTWVAGSLENEASLRSLLNQCAAVIHCAGAIKARSRDEFIDINAGGTRRLAAVAATQIRPPRFIHVSSLAAREPQLSSYAASKRAAEQALRPYMEPLRVSILRPPAVYGPGDMETLRIFQMAEQGLLPAPAGQAGRLSLVHVEDAAAAIVAVLEEPGAPSLVEFDDGRGGYTWAEIAAAAGAALGTRPRVLPVPSPLLYIAGALGSLGARLTGRPSVVGWGKIREFLHPDWASQGPALVGYTPLWNLEKGFVDAVKWYRSRGLLKSNG